MASLSTLIQRKPLVATALIVALIKSLQLAIDSTALFYFDSAAYIFNALGIGFVPHRSYLYGWLIRIFALPFHSLRAIVAMQVAMGCLTAWLLAYVLIRFFKTWEWIAIGAALIFALDPVQVVHEHMVMAETVALLVAAIYFTAALAYLEKPAPWKLVLPAFLGAVLAGLRVVYVPVVMASAVMLPLFGGLRRRGMPALALALTVSIGSTAIFQVGYRHLTGRLAGREPAYHYLTGFFLAATVSPLLRPDDTDDPRVAAAVAEQSKSAFPLYDSDHRAAQLFGSQSLAARMVSKFNGDEKAANQAADRLARRAIRERPVRFLWLGLKTYFKYWRGIPELQWILTWENGSPPRSEVMDGDVEVIRSVFGVDVSKQYLLETPSRRYHTWGRYWCVFLLLAPYLSGMAALLTRRNGTGAAFLFAWGCCLLTATCLGGVEYCYRFMHPFSFTGLAAVAVLFELSTKRSRGGKTTLRDRAHPAAATADHAAACVPPKDRERLAGRR